MVKFLRSCNFKSYYPIDTWGYIFLKGLILFLNIEIHFLYILSCLYSIEWLTKYYEAVML